MDGAAEPVVPKAPRRGIVYWFLVSAVPVGGAPEDIRLDWMGVPLPVRRPRPIEGPLPLVGRDVVDARIRRPIDDGVPVELADAVRALRLFGRGNAADWWEELAARRGKEPVLAFRTGEGRLLPPHYARLLFPELDSFEGTPDWALLEGEEPGAA